VGNTVLRTPDRVLHRGTPWFIDPYSFQHFGVCPAVGPTFAERFDKITRSWKIVTVVPLVPPESLPEALEPFLLSVLDTQFPASETTYHTRLSGPGPRGQDHDQIGLIERISKPPVVHALKNPGVRIQDPGEHSLLLVEVTTNLQVTAGIVPMQIVERVRLYAESI